MNPVIRPASREDAARAGEICYAAFHKIAEHHAFPPDFPGPDVSVRLVEYLLQQDAVHAVVAEIDGRVVGSNFLWEEERTAGIGPITVDPGAQDSRVGRRLMDAVLERAQHRGIASVRLVQAAYHARSLSLYSKLGFAVREPLAVMQGPALDLRIAGHVVRAATLEDVDAADALCLRVHGHARSSELRAALRQGTAAVVERGTRLTGYTTGIGFFGHAVGETTADLQALIGAAPAFDGPGFLIPLRDAELTRWCLESGLRIVQPMTLMTMGPYAEPAGAFLPSVLY